jgi:hypothetical protein
VTQRGVIRFDPAAGYPAGSTIRYRCGVCGDVLSSLPDRPTACSCRNVTIDPDAGRLAVKDHSAFEAFSADEET